MATAAYCPRCAHFRLRQRPQLFSAADMQSTGGLKASLEWEQQQDQLRLLEQQRMDAGEVLTYEPQFHPWCAAASPFDEAILQAVDEAAASDDAERPGLADKARDLARVSRDEASDLIARAKQGDYDAITRLVEGRRVTVNPVAGDIQSTYVLCQRVNRQSRCPLFEPKET